MPGLTKGSGTGFSKVLAGSFVLHIIVIAIGLLFFNAPERKIFTPVYTVDLVAGRPKPRRPAKKARARRVKAPKPKAVKKASPKPAKKPVRVKKAQAKRPAPAKKKTVKVAAKPREKVSVSSRIEEIARKKEREREARLLTSSIEDIRRKQEAQSQEVSRRIEELKKRLASQRAAPEGPSPEDASPAPAAQAAPAPAGAGGERIGFAGRSGVTSENLHTKYREYYNLIHDRVHEQWIYPNGFEYDKVSVIVSIRIDRSGNLIKSWLEESSGNRSFDDSLINATKKAAPYPPLPVDYEGNFLEVGLRFCPSCPE
ncbi:MAG: energy transducer TonB [Thermodesulfobacteriota bacterium]